MGTYKPSKKSIENLRRAVRNLEKLALPAEKKLLPALRASLCRAPDCPRVAIRRGLCKSCYELICRKAIKQGMGWPELEALGIVLPAAKPHGGSVLKWLEEVKEKASVKLPNKKRNYERSE